MTKEELEEAYSQVDPELLEVIRKALVNIRSYHEKQRRTSWFDSKEDGTLLGQKITPLARVVVNRVSMQMESERITEILNKLKTVL